MSEVVIALTTVPSVEVGEEIARSLVEARLAACVNVLPAMTSIYRWNGAVHREPEHQLVIKTAKSLIDALRERVAALHPYDLPELLVIPVSDGEPAYLAWVLQETEEADR
ncbi:MAG: divalent-cation tolerance protein CutA [Vicinamibacterales bacterium]